MLVAALKREREKQIKAVTKHAVAEYVWCDTYASRNSLSEILHLLLIDTSGVPVSVPHSCGSNRYSGLIREGQ